MNSPLFECDGISQGTSEGAKAIVYIPYPFVKQRQACIEIGNDGNNACSSSFIGRKVSGVTDVVVLKSGKNSNKNPLLKALNLSKKQKRNQDDNYTNEIFNLNTKENDINIGNIDTNLKGNRSVVSIHNKQSNKQDDQSKQQRSKHMMEQFYRSSEYPISKMLANNGNRAHDRKHLDKSKNNKEQQSLKKSKERLHKSNKKPAQNIGRISKSNLLRAPSNLENISFAQESQKKQREMSKSKGYEEKKQLLQNISAKQKLQQIKKQGLRQKSVNHRESRQQNLATEQGTLNTEIDVDLNYDNNCIGTTTQCTATFEGHTQPAEDLQFKQNKKITEDANFKNSQKQRSKSRNKRVNSQHGSLNYLQDMPYSKTTKSSSTSNKYHIKGSQSVIEVPKNMRYNQEQGNARIMSVPHNQVEQIEVGNGVNQQTSPNKIQSKIDSSWGNSYIYSRQQEYEFIYRNKHSDLVSYLQQHQKTQMQLNFSLDYFLFIFQIQVEELIARQQEEQHQISKQQKKLQLQIENEQIRIQNAQRFLKPKIREQICFPWGFNQQKVQQIQEEQRRREERSQERIVQSQVHQMRCDENLRRQRLGLDFLNNIDEESINLLKRNLKNEQQQFLEQKSCQGSAKKEKSKEEHQGIQEFIEIKKMKTVETEKELQQIKVDQKFKIQRNLQRLNENVKKMKLFSKQSAFHKQYDQEIMNSKKQLSLSQNGGLNKRKTRSKSSFKQNSQEIVKKQRSHSNGWTSQPFDASQSYEKFEELNNEFKVIIRSALEEQKLMNNQKTYLNEQSGKHGSSLELSEGDSLLSQSSNQINQIGRQIRSQSCQNQQQQQQGHYPQQMQQMQIKQIQNNQQPYQKKNIKENKRKRGITEVQQPHYFVNQYGYNRDNQYYNTQNTVNSGNTTLQSFITKNSKENSAVIKDNMTPQKSNISSFEMRKLKLLEQFLNLGPKFEQLCSKKGAIKRVEQIYPDVPSENDIVEEQLVIDEFQSQQSQPSSRKSLKTKYKHDDSNSAFTTSNPPQNNTNSNSIGLKHTLSNSENYQDLVEGGIAKLVSPKGIFKLSKLEELKKISSTTFQESKYEESKFQVRNSQQGRNKEQGKQIIKLENNDRLEDQFEQTRNKSYHKKSGNSYQKDLLQTSQDYQKEIFQSSQSFQDLKDSSRIQLHVASSFEQEEGEREQDKEEQEQLREIREIQKATAFNNSRQQNQKERYSNNEKGNQQINVVIQPQFSHISKSKDRNHTSSRLGTDYEIEPNYKINSNFYYDATDYRQLAALTIQRVWKGCQTRKIIKYHLELQQQEDGSQYAEETEFPPDDEQLREVIIKYLIETGQDYTEEEFEAYVEEFKKIEYQQKEEKEINQKNNTSIQSNNLSKHKNQTENSPDKQNNQIHIQDQLQQQQPQRHIAPINNSSLDYPEGKSTKSKRKVNLGIVIDENEIICAPMAPQLKKKTINQQEEELNQQIERDEQIIEQQQEMNKELSQLNNGNIKRQDYGRNQTYQTQEDDIEDEEIVEEEIINNQLTHSNNIKEIPSINQREDIEDEDTQEMEDFEMDLEQLCQKSLFEDEEGVFIIENDEKIYLGQEELESISQYVKQKEQEQEKYYENFEEEDEEVEEEVDTQQVYQQGSNNNTLELS